MLKTSLKSFISPIGRRMKPYIKRMKSHRRMVIIASLILLAGSIAGVVKWQGQSGVPETPPIWVKTASVSVKQLPLQAEAIGSLVARSVAITPEFAGHVDKVYFKDGDQVKMGDPLYQLDDAIYRAKYASSQAKYDYSKINYDRMVLLGQRGAIAVQAIDEAKAALGEAKAVADENKVILDKLVLRAPFSGVVGKSLVTKGDFVSSGQALVSLTDNEHLRLEYVLPEQYLPSVKLGQRISLHAAAYPGIPFQGMVAFISPNVNIDSRTVSVYANVANDDKRLFPGMFVDISHVLAKDRRVMMIPARSLIPMLEGQQVYKLMDGKAYATNVKIGLRHDEMIEIEDGLKQGDIVVTDGQMKLKNGSPVKALAS